MGLPICERGDLREIDVGDWSGLTFAAIQSRYPDEWAASYPVLDPDLARGGGESYHQAQQRALQAIHAIAESHAGERVLVFFHGGVLQAVLVHLLQMPLPNKRFLQTSNASISRVHLTTENGNLSGRVLGINDVAHLEQMGQYLSGVGPE